MRKDIWKFVHAAIFRPFETGAFSPSSRSIGLEITKAMIDRPNARVLELGPGTGPLTAVAQERLGKPELYLGLELNPAFIQILRQRFPNLRFIQDSAENAVEHTGGPGTIDVVISSLPWTVFPLQKQEAILSGVVKAMAPGAHFSTYAYAHVLWTPQLSHMRKLFKRHFSKVERSRVIWKNAPPAFVYHCVK